MCGTELCGVIGTGLSRSLLPWDCGMRVRHAELAPRTGGLMLRTWCLLLLVGDVAGLVVPGPQPARTVQGRPRVTPRMEFGDAFYSAAVPLERTACRRPLSHRPCSSNPLPVVSTPAVQLEPSAAAPTAQLLRVQRTRTTRNPNPHPNPNPNPGPNAVGYNYAAQYGPQPGDAILPTDGDTWEPALPEGWTEVTRTLASRPQPRAPSR